MDPLERWQRITQIGQALATAVALLVGAWWFWQQRQIYPHAQVEQSIDVVNVGPGLIGVEVQVRFANTGKLLIHLTHATVKPPACCSRMTSMRSSCSRRLLFCHSPSAFRSWHSSELVNRAPIRSAVMKAS